MHELNIGQVNYVDRRHTLNKTAIELKEELHLVFSKWYTHYNKLCKQIKVNVKHKKKIEKKFE